MIRVGKTPVKHYVELANCLQNQKLASPAPVLAKSRGRTPVDIRQRHQQMPDCNNFNSQNLPISPHGFHVNRKVLHESLWITRRPLASPTRYLLAPALRRHAPAVPRAPRSPRGLTRLAVPPLA
jgi:hypothetical protein